MAYKRVSRRSYWLMATVPMACLPMAHWYVFRGDWLWCGYGIRPAGAGAGQPRSPVAMRP
jgi:hypothetical protein